MLWAVATASFLTLPVRYTPTVFKVPFVPFVPSLGVLACLHLIGSLGWPAYVRWIIWFTLGTTVYLTYSLHHSQVGVGTHARPHAHTSVRCCACCAQAAGVYCAILC